MGEHASSRRLLWRLKDRVPSSRNTSPQPSQYDEDEDRFLDKATIAVKDLEKIIKAHDNEPDNALKVGDSSWDLVFDQMAAAKTRDEEKSGLRSKISAGSDLMSAYINLIPDEYGIGILKGSLALIFDATKAHDENRNRILETFQTIPESILTINMAFNLLDPGLDDVKIQSETLSMLVEDLPVFIKILVGEKKWYRKVVKFLSLSIPETMTIDNILLRWNQKVAQLQEHVQRMKLKMCSKFSIELGSISDKIKLSDVGIRTLFAESQTMQTALFDNIKKGHASILSEISRNNDIAAGLASVIQEHLEDQRRYMEERHRLLIYDFKKLHQPRPSLIAPIQLLKILGITMRDLARDKITVFQHSEQFGADSNARAWWLVNTVEFRDWLRENHSSLLLVDEELQDSFTSPLSGVCQELPDELTKKRGVEAFFFFSGLHVDARWSGVQTGPVALIMSLICQLLMSTRLPEFDLGFMDIKMIRGCKERNCEVLCTVFAELFTQVPPGMIVYCIIDGISWYENDRWLNDLKVCAATLEDVAAASNYGPSGFLKVLFTSPIQSMEIGRLARKNGELWRHVSLAAGHIHPNMGFMDSNSLLM